MNAARPRVRPAIRWLAMVMFAVLLPVAAHALWDHVELRRLVREVQAIRDRGEPVTEEDAGLGYRGSTDEHRLASQYYLAAAVLAPGPVDAPALRQVREWVHGGLPLQQPLEASAAAYARLHEASRDALRFADRAAALEFRGLTPGTEFSYRASSLAQMLRQLAARTIYLSLAGDQDQAVESAFSAIRARRVLGHVRWFVVGDHEVPIILSLSTPSATALQRLQAALDAEEAGHDPARGLIEERARAVEMIWRRYYGPDPNATDWYSLPRRSIMETLFRPWFTHQTVAALRRWAEEIVRARRPWTEKGREGEAATARLRQARVPRYRFVREFLLLEPFLSGSVLAALDPTTLVRDRCARVAVAIERFRRDHAGALPEALSALTPAYIDELPEDPLSGAPLRFSRQADAYLVYSIGPNGRDDRGDVASELHTAQGRGWGRRVIRGTDIGVRVLVRRERVAPLQ